MSLRKGETGSADLISLGSADIFGCELGSLPRVVAKVENATIQYVIFLILSVLFVVCLGFMLLLGSVFHDEETKGFECLGLSKTLGE